MSTLQPTLFGAYPWAVAPASSPTLWGTGFIPQTYSVTLADSVTGSEADLVRLTAALAETTVLSEAQIFTIRKILADSATISDATVQKTIERVFLDTLSVSDQALFFTIKELSDFLILKEWISIRLEKQISWVTSSPNAAAWTGPGTPPVPVWINPSTNANIFDTLWGKYQYGRVLFGGLKPLASWSKGPVTQPSVWTNSDGHKYNS